MRIEDAINHVFRLDGECLLSTYFFEPLAVLGRSDAEVLFEAFGEMELIAEAELFGNGLAAEVGLDQ